MLVVTTLGKFQIMNGSGSLSETSFRSPMLSKLFIYCLLHRDKVLSIDELSSALWQEDETDNPPGALKNLMYRLRNLLKSELGEEDFILTSRGSYQWNPEVKVSFDVEQFGSYLEEARADGKSDEERIHNYEKAIALYHGEFMPKIMDMQWVVVEAAHCHKNFIDAVKELAALYLEKERFDSLESLCIQALKMDNVDENLHRYLILARVRSGKGKLAQEAYDKACDVLYKELGVRNPQSLEDAHQEILALSGDHEVAKIQEAHEEMNEEDPNGVYYVKYEVFKSIYQLEARKTSRMGIAEYILMLTVDMDSAAKEDELSVAERTRISDTMDALQETLSSCLRLGDVASKYSASQFIVLLPNCNYESSLVVANRIIDKFYKENRKFKNMKIRMSVEEVSPVRQLAN